jgi:hypothetical protein
MSKVLQSSTSAAREMESPPDSPVLTASVLAESVQSSPKKEDSVPSQTSLDVDISFEKSCQIERAVKSELPEIDLLPSSISIVQTQRTLNRAIEGVYSTDVVWMFGRFPERLLDKAGHQNYTRNFEPAGDYVPNLAYSSDAKEVKFFCPDEWEVLAFKEKSMKLVDPAVPVKDGWIRYRTLPGKFFDVYFGTSTPKNFIRVQNCPWLHGFSLSAVRVRLTEEDLSERGKLTTNPLTPAELFAKAIELAGGVENLSLVYHNLPSLEKLGGTADAKRYRNSRLEGSSLKFGKTVADFKTACIELASSLKDKWPLNDNSFEPIYGFLTQEASEAEARQIYEAVIDAFPLYRNIAQPEAEEHYWYDESEEESEYEPCYASLHIASTLHVLPFERLEEIEVTVPLYVVPEICSQTLDDLLKFAPLLIANGALLYRGILSGVTDYYAPSVTPRHPNAERGSGGDGILWYEKMQVTFEYHGLLFTNTKNAKPLVRQWVLSVNTQLIENFLAYGPYSPVPKVRCCKTPMPWPTPAPPTYAGGLGLLEDQLVVSPLIEDLDLWRSSGLRDARTRLPTNVCLEILKDPRCKLVNAAEFLRGEGPLFVEVRTNRTRRQFAVSEHIRYHPDAKTADEIITYEVARKDESAPTVVKEPPVRQPVSIETLQFIPFESSTEKDDPEGIKPLRLGPNVDKFGIPNSSSAEGMLMANNASPIVWGSALRYETGFSMEPNWVGVANAVRKGHISLETARNMYSICLAAANGYALHPIVPAINPLFVNLLKNMRMDKHWWSWPTRRMTVHPFFTINDSGQLPMSLAKAAAVAEKERKKGNREKYFEQQLVNTRLNNNGSLDYPSPLGGGRSTTMRGTFRGRRRPLAVPGSLGRGTGRVLTNPSPHAPSVPVEGIASVTDANTDDPNFFGEERASLF